MKISKLIGEGSLQLLEGVAAGDGGAYFDQREITGCRVEGSTVVIECGQAGMKMLPGDQSITKYPDHIISKDIRLPDIDLGERTSCGLYTAAATSWLVPKDNPFWVSWA